MAKKGIINLFYKTDDEDPKAQAQTGKTPATVTIPAAPVQTSVGVIGQEDSEIKKQLADALEQANLPGYDYFEFAKAVDAQASILPSEELRFKSSFVGAQASDPKITSDALIAAAQKYLGVLKQKEAEFNSAVEKHSVGSVVAKDEAIKKIDLDMQAKAEDIKRVTEEINAMQQQKTTLTNEISTAKAEIDKVRNNFQATLQVFVKKITSDIDKIKSYLGGK
jgi:hypothetical protein